MRMKRNQRRSNEASTAATNVNTTTDNETLIGNTNDTQRDTDSKVMMSNMLVILQKMDEKFTKLNDSNEEFLTTRTAKLICKA